MPAPTVVNRVHLPSLAAELPGGWTVSEAATLASPSGTDIHLKLERAPDGWTATEVADDMASAEQAGRSVVNGTTSKSMTLRGGAVAEDRRFQFERDGATWVARVVCSVNAGLALTVRASWPANNDAADADVDAAVAGLRVLSHPVSSPSQPEAATPVASQKRASVDASTWSALRGRWASNFDVGQPHPVTRWSAAELAVFATILGSPSFPTVGSELLASLPEAALAPTLEWVTRSLLARRLIEPAAEGSTKIADQLGGVMEVAVFPDLTISVERFDVQGASRTWFGVRPDRAVQIEVSADGTRECAVIEPETIVARMVGNLRSSEDGGPLEDTADVVSMTRFTTAWRDGELIRGGTFAVATGADGALALADPDTTGSSGWQLRPTDTAGLQAAALEHLPGG